jgi:predicted carbohydrate-binding protein with CBM5 and CBM33 domain
MRLKMRRRGGIALASTLTAVAAVAASVLTAAPASAHGAMQIPGSRTFLCYEDGLTSTGQIIPNNPACAAAIAQSGPTPLYNWFAVGNPTANGGKEGVIPDGKLCSGNSPYYDFSGFDLARSDWPVTHLTSGATIEIHYNKWAAHPGTFSLYVTRDGWDPSQPLTWADLESVPFSTVTDPPSVGNPGSIDSYYYWDATLPANKTGYHIIYSIWARSDSTETFYGCSDVVFDGGDGQVTGIGPGCCTGSSSASRAASRPAAREDVASRPSWSR